MIFFQIVFATSLLLLSYLFFTHLYDSLLRTLISEIIQGISSGGFSGEENIVDTLEIVKANNFVAFASILVILTAIFTFFIARMSIKPTKDALGLQKRFISDIAHELRTPLAIVKTNNEVLLMDKDLDKKLREFLKSNIEELDRMSEIINNVLSFNNLLQSKKIKFEKVDLGQVMDSVIEKLGRLAAKKDIEIGLEKVPPHLVWGNAVALGQVIGNLLKNAINYTPRKGKVSLRLWPDYYGNTVIRIEDTGVGISKKDLAHIFEPFYRAERSRNRSNGSSGLGLTIASEIVKMHSGKLTIKSVENKGTTAIVTIPYDSRARGKRSADTPSSSEVSINFLAEK